MENQKKKLEDTEQHKKYFLKVKEFKDDIDCIIISEWIEQHIGLKDYDGVFTISFVPAEEFNWAQASIYRPIPENFYTAQNKNWIKSAAHDAFDHYKVFVYDFNESEMGKMSRNPNQLHSSKSLTQIHSFKMNQTLRISSPNKLSTVEERKLLGGNHFKSTKMIKFENMMNSAMSESSDRGTTYLDKIQDDRESRALKYKAPFSFPPKINPDLLKFIQTLLLADDLTLLNIKNSQNKSLHDPITMLTKIKSLISQSRNYDEVSVHSLLKEFILSLQEDFEGKKADFEHILSSIKVVSSDSDKDKNMQTEGEKSESKDNFKQEDSQVEIEKYSVMKSSGISPAIVDITSPEDGAMAMRQSREREFENMDEQFDRLQGRWKDCWKLIFISYRTRRSRRKTLSRP
jgi:hypothetical protein